MFLTCLDPSPTDFHVIYTGGSGASNSSEVSRFCTSFQLSPLPVALYCHYIDVLKGLSCADVGILATVVLWIPTTFVSPVY